MTMLNIRAGAPASVAAACALLATTATVGLIFTGTPSEAMGAFGLAVACAHACASRHAADKAMEAVRSAAALGATTVREMIALSMRMTRQEQQIKALKDELAANPPSFNPVPEVANDGR